MSWQAQKLSNLVQYVDGAIVSRAIIDTPAGSITLFALDKEQKISEHRTPFDAVVEVVDGSGRFTVGSESITVSAGQLLVMPANVPHAVNAVEKFKMLLTMIRG